MGHALVRMPTIVLVVLVAPGIATMSVVIVGVVAEAVVETLAEIREAEAGVVVVAAGEAGAVEVVRPAPALASPNQVDVVTRGVVSLKTVISKKAVGGVRVRAGSARHARVIPVVPRPTAVKVMGAAGVVRARMMGVIFHRLAVKLMLAAGLARVRIMLGVAAGLVIAGVTPA